MGVLVGTYLFGSHARGDIDERSDLDVLAIVENNQGRVPVEEVVRTLPDSMKEISPTITWYGRSRLEQMFGDGELFCWHLYLEAMRLTGPSIGSLFPKPSGYTKALDDVASFRDVLKSTPQQLRASEANAIYECGVAYVCIRNIAMSASWHLLPRPDFSRYSPFRLPPALALPMSMKDYETSMACRMAGQRGHAAPPGIESEFVLKCASVAAEWAARITGRLGETICKQG